MISFLTRLPPLLVKLLHVSRQQQRQRRELGLQQISLLGIDLRGELRQNVWQQHAILVMPKLQGPANAMVVDVGATAARSNLQRITAIFIDDPKRRAACLVIDCFGVVLSLFDLLLQASRSCLLWSCAFIV